MTTPKSQTGLIFSRGYLVNLSVFSRLPVLRGPYPQAEGAATHRPPVYRTMTARPPLVYEVFHTGKFDTSDVGSNE